MRKINLAPKPVELTEDEEHRLVNEYLSDKSKPVWRKKYIVDTLLAMTYNKCAYSEAKLQVGGAYMDVDHFHPKILYEKEVAHWGNLLPATKTSNSTKGNFDTGRQPIINPLIDNPNEYLRFVGCICMVKKNISDTARIKADNSIRKYALNSDQFVDQRAEKIADNDTELKLLREELDEGVFDGADGPKKRWICRFEARLSTANPTRPYSVCIGQAIKDNPDFRHIKEVLQAKQLLVGSILDYLNLLPQ